MSTTARQKIDRIPAGNQYEGYVWLSNATAPKVYVPGRPFTDDFPANDIPADAIPFVVEAWLYDKGERMSYAIRYLNGSYVRIAYNLELSSGPGRSYRAHDIPGFQDFHSIEHWVAEKDERCDNMEVLRHAWTAFAGFKNPVKK